MARKKGKVSSKKIINDGDSSAAGGSDANVRFSSATSVVYNFGYGSESSASKAPVATSIISDQSYIDKCLMNSFYEKLVNLHQSSGLSYAFNFRETLFDLYLLYRKVTERGGFHQVSKEGKWNEVGSVLNLKPQIAVLPGQIQKVYETLLLQYEQMHYYRTPAKVHSTPDLSPHCGSRSVSSLAKRKSDENSAQDDQVTKGSFASSPTCELSARQTSRDNPSQDDQVGKWKFDSSLTCPTSTDLSSDYENRSVCLIGKPKACDDSSQDDQLANRNCTSLTCQTSTGLSSNNRNNSVYSVGKQKACGKSSQDDQVAKRMCISDSRQKSTGPGTPEQKSNIQIRFDNKDIKDLRFPVKPRNAYQIFVKMECDRLRKIHGEGSGNMCYRNMATEAWKHLSQNDRLPYVEASQKDKDRFQRDMLVYEQTWNQKIAKKQHFLCNSTPSIINFGPSSPIDDGYYVTLEADTGNFFVPDESLVESTIQIMKNSRPNDPMLQINWDGCCGSPDS